MKASTVFAASAVVAMISIDSVVGLAKYLDQIPNGSNFAKSLGHTDDGYTDFGTAFSKAGATWTADFCKAMFPGTTISNGAAFGDPCCTWKVGGTPDKTITVWTDKPTIATVCASAASTAPASSSSAPSSGSSSSGSSTPAVTTAAPSSGSSSSSSSSSSTPAPAATTAAPASSGSSSSGSSSSAPSSSKKTSKCKVKEDKSVSSDDEDDDDN